MAKFEPQAELPVSEQAQIRREKLAALQAEGRDPFVQTKFDFNSDSAAIKADYEGFEGKTVSVEGELNENNTLIVTQIAEVVDETEQTEKDK